MTGVQTCALPIYPGRLQGPARREHGPEALRAFQPDAHEPQREVRDLVRRREAGGLSLPLHAAPRDEHEGRHHRPVSTKTASCNTKERSRTGSALCVVTRGAVAVAR